MGVQDGPVPPGPPQVFCRIDLDAGIVEDQWHAGRRKFLDEFVLVSKKKEQRSDGADSNSKASVCDTEDGVWLVAPCFDAERQITSFVILDGHDLKAGPIFEAELDHHIPWALHGSWYSCPEK
jgi:carotenoid cleavage dioxygenase-like enzyme